MKRAILLIAAFAMTAPIWGESYPSRGDRDADMAEADGAQASEVQQKKKKRGFLSPLPFLKRAIPFKRGKEEAQIEDEFAKEIGLEKVEKKGPFRRFVEFMEFDKRDEEVRPKGENFTTNMLRNLTGDASTLINAFVRNWPVAPGRKPMEPYQPYKKKNLVDLELAEIALLSPESLAATGFKLLWKKEDLEDIHVVSLTITEENVLLETKRNEVLGLSREDGRVDWVFDFESELDTKPLETAKGLYVVASDIFYYIQEPALGVYDWRRPMPFAASTKAVPYGVEGLLFGSTVGRVHMYNHKHKFDEWRVTCKGQVMEPISVDDRFAVFSSDGGYVYKLDLLTHRYNWRFSKTLREISSPPVLDQRGDRPMVYAGTKDQYLVGLRYSDGEMPKVGDFDLFEVLLSGPITEQPVLHGEDLILAISNGGGLHAIDRNTAKEKWYVRGISKIISKGEGEVYCLTSDNLLVGVNLKSGVVRWSYDVSPFMFIPQNLDESFIVLATNSGSVFALLPPIAGTPFEDVEQLKPAGDAEGEAPGEDVPAPGSEIAPSLDDL